MAKDVLVYGAGVIGSIYALRLAKAGHRVALLARGERLVAIGSEGLRIRHAFLGTEERAEVGVIDGLPAETRWDLVIVAVRSGQVENALGTLRAARTDGPLLVLGNNLGDLDAEAETIGRARAVFGFGALGGYRDGAGIIYLDGRTAEKPGRANRTTVGVIGDEARGAMGAVRAILEDAGLPCAESRDMRSWYLCHAALVFPLALSMYAAGGDQARYCDSPALIRLGVGACKECFASLRALGCKVEPRSLWTLLLASKGALARMIARRFRGEAARVAMFGHANSPGGREEISSQAAVLDHLLKRTRKPTPSWDRLLVLNAGA